MRVVRWGIAGVLAICFAVVAAAFLFQRNLIYPIPQSYRTTPAAAGFPEAEEVALNTSDGEKVIIWHAAPQPGHPVVLFFHGNGEVLAMRARAFRALTADGTGLVALSFRGYGGSTGQPTEQGLFDDAAAAYAFAAARYEPDRLVAWGYSLGSGVALEVATHNRFGKVILEAPFTSMTELAARAFPWLPVRLLMRDRLQSDERVGRLRAPLLVMHGKRDSVVPFEMGERLFDLAPEPKQFVGFPAGTHFNLQSIGAIETAKRFISVPLQN